MEALVEKKIEHSQILEDMSADLDAVTRERQAYVDGLVRSAALPSLLRTAIFRSSDALSNAWIRPR